MMYNKMHLTNAGRHLATSLIAGEVLTFTKVGIGAGEPISKEQIAEMTGLLNPKAYFPIAEVKDNEDGTVSIMTTFTNKDNEARFYIREIGVFAQDPKRGEILFGVIPCGDAADLFSAKTDKELSVTMRLW